jgi:3-hydroxybutyryl-CoA dehydrogenase
MAPPRTILITPTKRLSIADLASCTYRADKCVALLADAQEISGTDLGTDTDEGSRRQIVLRTPPQATSETVAIVREFWERVGFAPTFEADQI